MRKVLVVAACLSISACSTYSLVERNTKSKLPEYVITHRQGIIVNPSKKDIDYAIKLGELSKDDNRLEYAYTHKETLSSFDYSDIYAYISTPLYLIAEHSKKQFRNYENLDSEYINYCKKLNVVAITVHRQYLVKSLNSYSFNQNFTLLYNGVKVKSVQYIHSYNGLDPFANTSDPIAKALKSSLAAQQISQKIMHKKIKQIEDSYKKSGLDDDQIKMYMEYTKSLYGISKQDKNQRESVKEEGDLFVGEASNIFTIDNLNKKGKYEIVFRTPKTSSVFNPGDKEVRFPISFKGFI